MSPAFTRKPAPGWLLNEVVSAGRENLGRGLRPAVASVVDCVRMLDASGRDADDDRLLRLRRMMELERQLAPSRRLELER